MAYLLTHFWPGATDEQYRATIAVVHPPGGLPDGQVYHAAGPTEGGMLIAAVWDSKEAADRFVQRGASGQHARRRRVQRAAGGARRRGEQPRDGMSGRAPQRPPASTRVLSSRSPRRARCDARGRCRPGRPAPEQRDPGRDGDRRPVGVEQRRGVRRRAGPGGHDRGHDRQPDRAADLERRLHQAGGEPLLVVGDAARRLDVQRREAEHEADRRSAASSAAAPRRSRASASSRSTSA